MLTVPLTAFRSSMDVHFSGARVPLKGNLKISLLLGALRSELLGRMVAHGSSDVKEVLMLIIALGACGIGVRGEEMGGFPRQVALKQALPAYNPKNPSALMGRFEPNTALKLLARDEAQGVYQVLFEGPNGQKVEAVCRVADVEKALTVRIPDEWLKGEQGYGRAVALQKESGIPILVWATWNDCPNCRNVEKYLEGFKPTMLLKEYLRVSVDERGAPDEVKFCKSHGFTGGNFYVLAANNSKPVDKLWAWKNDAHDIVDGLENVLAGKLREAKKGKAN